MRRGGFPDSFWESYSAFANIRFGERAGSGLNGIVYVWKKVYNTDPEIFVKEEYDRTFLKLPTLGKEPDVEAMAEFYPDEEETSDKQATNIDTVDKTSDKQAIDDPVNVTVNDPVNENVTIKRQLLALISNNPYGTYSDYAQLLDKSQSTVKRMLKQMKNKELIRRVGAKKNGHWEVIDNQSEK